MYEKSHFGLGVQSDAEMVADMGEREDVRQGLLVVVHGEGQREHVEIGFLVSDEGPAIRSKGKRGSSEANICDQFGIPENGMGRVTVE